MGGDELAQVRAAHDRARRRLERHHRGAAHAAVERQLADVFAGAVGGDDDLLAFGVGRVDLDAAAQDDVERVDRSPSLMRTACAGYERNPALARDLAQQRVVERRRR